MLYLRLLLLCITLAVALPICAQEPQQPVRMELALEQHKAYIHVMAIPDSSLLLYIRKTDDWNRNPTVTLEKYNARLEQVWTANLNLKSEDVLLRHFTEAPYTYMVFKTVSPGWYTFARIHLASGRLSQSEVQLEKTEFIDDFVVLRGRHFVVAGNSYDSRPNLFYLDPSSPKPIMLPAMSGSQSSFSDMVVNPELGRLDVIISENNGRISRLQVKSFDYTGRLLHNYFILQQDKRSLLNAKVSPGDTLSRLLFGTYSGTRDLQTAQGFFTSPVASQVVSGEFYSVLQLQNFYKHLKPRREERIRKREMARVKAGKEPTLRYRMILHNLITTPTGYILPAELYYTQQRSSPNYFDMRFRGLNRMPVVYKRSHAVALGFDRDGVLLWDNSFALPQLITEDLVQAIEVAALPDGRVIMAYPDKDKIHYRIMQQDKFSNEDTSIDILLHEQNEKITSTDYSGIISWYSHHFAAFGFHHVRNPNGPNRSVFYINKVTF